MKRTLKYFLLVAIVGIMGCAGRPISDMSTEEKAYKVLATSLSVYNLTMESVADLQMDGFIDQEKRAKINSVAGKYRFAHLSAANALFWYKKLQDTDSEQKLIVALDVAQDAFSQFIAYVQPILRERIQ